MNEHGQTRRKGAIQMSLGMIVAVVFAVILLVFLVQWIGGMFETVTYLTSSITQQAHEELSQNLQQGIEKIGFTVPNKFTQKKNAVGKFEIGIRNDQYNDKCFIIDINLEQADLSVRSTECTGNPQYPCESLINKAENWFTFIPYAWIDAQEITYTIVDSDVSDAVPGAYMFRVKIYTSSDESEVGCGVGSVTDPNMELYEYKDLEIRIEA